MAADEMPAKARGVKSDDSYEDGGSETKKRRQLRGVVIIVIILLIIIVMIVIVVIIRVIIMRGRGALSLSLLTFSAAEGVWGGTMGGLRRVLMRRRGTTHAYNMYNQMKMETFQRVA